MPGRKEEPVSTKPRVLIVEDEPLIAMMLEDFLAALDLDIAGTADTSEAAIKLIETADVTAAVLDVNLRRGEKSWPVADALVARGTPFLFASGGDDSDIPPAYADHPVLPKPFTMDGITQALQRLGI